MISNFSIEDVLLFGLREGCEDTDAADQKPWPALTIVLSELTCLRTPVLALWLAASVFGAKM